MLDVTTELKLANRLIHFDLTHLSKSDILLFLSYLT